MKDQKKYPLEIPEFGKLLKDANLGTDTQDLHDLLHAADERIDDLEADSDCKKESILRALREQRERIEYLIQTKRKQAETTFRR